MEKLIIGVPPVDTRDTIDWMTEPVSRPWIVTIFGDGGMGKTTMGALFNKPVFVKIEDGSKSILKLPDVKFSPLVQKTDDIDFIISDLLTKRHDRKTVVFDTISALDRMIEKEILDLDAEKNGGKFRAIGQAMGGFGNATKAIADKHGKIRGYAEQLINAGMCVVFLGHADVENIALPDQEPFQRYTIRLTAKAMPHYTDNVDLVGMIKLEMYTRGEGKQSKAIGTGSRIITCYSHPAHVSKNRFGISQDLPWDGKTNPLQEYLR